MTLWVPDSEGELLDEARKAIGGDDSLSGVFRDCLRREVERRKVYEDGFERVELGVEGPSGWRTVAFTGKLLAATNGLPVDASIYLSKKGKLLIHYPLAGHEPNSYAVYDSIEALAKHHGGRRSAYNDMIAAAADALGTAWVQELDI